MVFFIKKVKVTSFMDYTLRKEKAVTELDRANVNYANVFRILLSFKNQFLSKFNFGKVELFRIERLAN